LKGKRLRKCFERKTFWIRVSRLAICWWCFSISFAFPSTSNFCMLRLDSKSSISFRLDMLRSTKCLRCSSHSYIQQYKMYQKFKERKRHSANYILFIFEASASISQYFGLLLASLCGFEISFARKWIAEHFQLLRNEGCSKWPSFVFTSSFCHLDSGLQIKLQKISIFVAFFFNFQ